MLCRWESIPGDGDERIFCGQEQSVTVFSETAPILHFELHIATENQSATVSAEAAPGQPNR